MSTQKSSPNKAETTGESPNNANNNVTADEDELALAVGKMHLTDSALQQAADYISEAQAILVLTGAGVSVSAGIPDFRSKGTGLYDNLQKYNLPYPEAVFDLQYYRKKPQPFVSLAREIWPGHHVPTVTHSFLTLLGDKKRLLRTYSQNIDGLEILAHLDPDLLVECHGHFRTASCIQCYKAADIVTVKASIFDNTTPICRSCKSFVKPDIVFFGEGLPERFHTLLKKDIPKADLCLILGTSLQVAPVSMIPEMVDCVRVLLNREQVGNIGDQETDVFCGGDCDDSVLGIVRLLGWEEELLMAHKKAKSAIRPRKIDTIIETKK